MSTENVPEGHRKRLRERFIKSGLAGFADYEVVELLLSLGTPRKTETAGQRSPQEIQDPARGAFGLDGRTAANQRHRPHSAFGIKLMQDVAREYLKEKIIDKPAFQSSQEIFDYLYHSMRDLKNEVFKVIYLNSARTRLSIPPTFLKARSTARR